MPTAAAAVKFNDARDITRERLRPRLAYREHQTLG